MYCLSSDALYFKNLSKITSMFKNIGELYREATQAETEEFLIKKYCPRLNYENNSFSISNEDELNS